MKDFKRTMLCFILSLICSVAMAQSFTASGTVRSDDGLEAIGATVVEKGATANGVVTDLDGHFTIKCSKDAHLLISYIGYKTAEVVAGENLEIVLHEDANIMEEVVVTGYQTQRKADLTGAVSVMNMKNPTSESNPNMLNSMQGKLSGVQIVTDAAPGSGSTSIRVRGMSTVNSTDPLYVIDGVPTTENLNSLNPSDIESIQVLKDAASASIYGARAANGVIVITTKGGKEGRTAININMSTSVQNKMKTYTMLNAQQWGEAYWQAAKNSGQQPSHPLYGNGDSPQLVSTLSDGATATTDTDWQDAIYRTAWSNNVSASISSASEKGSVMFSANYINQQGIIKQTYYKRITARINSTYKFNKWISVGENLMVARWDNRGAATGSDSGIPFTAMRQHPALPIKDASGAYTSPMKYINSDITNPVEDLNINGDDENGSWRIFGNAYLQWEPIKNLTLKSNIGIEHVQFLNRDLTRTTYSNTEAAVAMGYGQGDTWTWTNTINYKFNIGENHRFNVFGGVEATEYVYKDLSASSKGYQFEDNNFMQIGAGTGERTVGGGKSEWALFSLFGKADWNYADRYLLSFIIRRDASSRLGATDNSAVFPSLSGAWRFTEEPWFPETDWLNNGKLRLGWGTNGNAGISNFYAAYSTYAINSGAGAYDLNGTGNTTVPGIVVASTGNPDLKWETTTQWNVGLDLGFLNNDLTVSLDWYLKKTRDMLTTPPALKVMGENASYIQNTGDMKNSGLELTIDYRSPQYGDFSWGANLNLAHYKNEVVRLNDAVTSIGSEIRLMKGEAMGVYYGYVSDGLFQTEEQVYNAATQQGAAPGRIRYRDLNNDGEITEADQCVIGDPNPDITGGLNLDFSYKNFTLSMFFTGEFGFDIYNSTKKQLQFMSYGGVSTNRSTDILNCWSESNTGSSIPAISLSDDNNEMRMSTYFVEDGSYVKMKYLKLSYAFPRKLTKGWCQGLTLYAQAENLFTMTGYSGLDPELPLSSYGSRVDSGVYPNCRTYTFGINLNF